MSEARKELYKIIDAWWKRPGGVAPVDSITDEIMSKLDVTVKEAASDEELGKMVFSVYQDAPLSPVHRGRVMKRYLQSAGLEIVRKDGEPIRNHTTNHEGVRQ